MPNATWTAAMGLRIGDLLKRRGTLTQEESRELLLLQAQWDDYKSTQLARTQKKRQDAFEALSLDEKLTEIHRFLLSLHDRASN